MKACPLPLPTWIVTLVAGLVAGCSDADSPSPPGPDLAVTDRPGAPHPLVAVWQFESGGYGAPVQPAPSDRVKLKVVTPSHFFWVEYDRETGRMISGAGGRCAISGDQYTEHLEFYGPDMESLRGMALTFEVDVQGDRMTQRGQIPGGPSIEEHWRRIPAPNPTPR